MGEYNVCIDGISAGMKILVNERYLLLLIGVQEPFVVAFDFGCFLFRSPTRRAVPIVLASMLLGSGGIGFGSWIFGFGNRVFAVCVGKLGGRGLEGYRSKTCRLYLGIWYVR